MTAGKTIGTAAGHPLGRGTPPAEWKGRRMSPGRRRKPLRPATAIRNILYFWVHIDNTDREKSSYYKTPLFVSPLLASPLPISLHSDPKTHHIKAPTYLALHSDPRCSEKFGRASVPFALHTNVFVCRKNLGYILPDLEIVVERSADNSRIRRRFHEVNCDKRLYIYCILLCNLIYNGPAVESILNEY